MTDNSNKSRPLIAVTTSNRGSRMMWWLNRLSVYLAGGKAHRMTPDTGPEATRDADALLIGGGDDIGAALYQGDVSLDIRIDPKRDHLEQSALAIALERGIPVLGVCRGAQMINVFLGGSLHQEIKDAFGLKKYRRTTLPLKHVHLSSGCRLGQIMARDKITANSLHHQAIDRLAPGLNAVGRDEIGIIQAIESPDHPFLFGVQWHPEFLFWQRPHTALFKALVRHSRQ
ncbi:gamma-glutamyl-gamma-aminobutyrate hydrolase family protein [Aestuariispira insulae]|uniref:Putative glutamine amidotransferase n=1 Tax=Aestuariispira insulae TaxID=1461337 RepID=A0A3D9H1K9_9PROT|nr:gamma-glutamyl-gamma-aminobutyrate hydrolase family protein [Aestuariispira insulae]RED43374.1 putative glutamine amidotransferase [Aestuariispira insulae]